MAVILVNPFYVSGGGGGSSTLLNDLVSWWDLDTDGTDDAASNDLSSAGSPSFGTVGGYASVTTSTGNHLYNASPTGLGLDTFSIAAWVYLTSSVANAQLAGVFESTTSATRRYLLVCAGLSAMLRVSDGTTVIQPQVSTSMSLTTWHLLIGTYNSSTGDAYIYLDDGANSNTQNSGYTTLNGAVSGFGIGGDGDGGGSGNETSGAIRSVGVWSRVITSDERTELWNSGVPLSYADL